MQLIYCNIRKFRNIEHQEIQLSDSYYVHVNDARITIEKKAPSRIKDYVYEQNFVRNLHVIVGKTGSGKTNLLQMIGMNKWGRLDSEKDDSYLMLYKMSKPDAFFVEMVGMSIEELESREESSWSMRHDSRVARFVYDFCANKIVKRLSFME